MTRKRLGKAITAAIIFICFSSSLSSPCFVPILMCFMNGLGGQGRKFKKRKMKNYSLCKIKETGMDAEIYHVVAAAVK